MIIADKKVKAKND